jgi:hypothetical protein
LKDARPAVNVPALSDPGSYHRGQVFETDRALYIACVDHVEYHLDDVAPFYCFIRIKKVEHIVVVNVSRSHYEFKGRLNAVILERSVALLVPPFGPATTTLGTVRCGISTIHAFILVIAEP